MKHALFPDVFLAVFAVPLMAFADYPTHSHKGPLTIATFSQLPDKVTFPEVVRRAGEPDEDVGSGLHVYRYRLADGSLVLVSTPDRRSIFSITHVVGSKSTTIWPRSK